MLQQDATAEEEARHTWKLWVLADKNRTQTRLLLLLLPLEPASFPSSLAVNVLGSSQRQERPSLSPIRGRNHSDDAPFFPSARRQTRAHAHPNPGKQRFPSSFFPSTPLVACLLVLYVLVVMVLCVGIHTSPLRTCAGVDHAHPRHARLQGIRQQKARKHLATDPTDSQAGQNKHASSSATTTTRKEGGRGSAKGCA